MYIIIGQGIAGVTAAITLRKLDPRTPVTIITEEHDYLYSRIDLPDIIAGKLKPADAMLQQVENFASDNIICIMGDKVAAVSPAQKTVQLVSGTQLKYTKLLFATGSVPIMPSLPGIDSPGVYSLWTLRQAKEMVSAAEHAQNAVVVGAGLIGLKTALALKARGLKATVVEKLPRVLPRQLDDVSAGILAEKVRSRGVDVLVNTTVDGIAASQGRVSGVHTAGGIIPAEMVVMSIGVKPNKELAAAAGIKTGRGIVVNEFQETSVPDVYAAGDVAEVFDSRTGESVVPAIWPVAVEQGKIAAGNMAGSRASYDGNAAMNAVEIAGLPLVSIGDVEGKPGDVCLTAQKNDAYRKVVLRDTIVKGVLCLGDIRQAGVIGRLVSHPVDIKEVEKLISPYFSYADLIAV